MIYLTMIVKDEAHIIERCLNSCGPYIDAVYILDTGSTDNTESVVKHWAKHNYKDWRYEHGPFNNFADARTRAIRGVKEWSKNWGWALVIDPDDVLVVEEDGLYYNALQAGSPRAGYNLMYRGGTELTYPRLNILNLKYHWQYKSVIHEYAEPIGVINPKIELLNGTFIDIVGGGARSQDEQKFNRDLAMLKEAAETETDPVMILRYMYYIGMTHMYAGNANQAIEAFELRGIQSRGKLDQEGCLSLLNAGKLTEALSMQAEETPSAKAFAYYLNAIEVCPTRAEPWYYAARSLRLRGLFASAYPYALYASTLKQDRMDTLAEVEVYRWCNDYELAIACLNVGDHKRGLKIVKRLETLDLPDDITTSLEILRKQHSEGLTR